MFLNPFKKKNTFKWNIWTFYPWIFQGNYIKHDKR